MFDWLRRLIKSFIPGPSPRIGQRLSRLEKGLAEIKEKLEDNNWTIDKLIIENMQADKLEFNLDAIDVKELSGMLSIGVNYGGKQIKMEGTKPTGEVPPTGEPEPEATVKKAGPLKTGGQKTAKNTKSKNGGPVIKMSCCQPGPNAGDHRS